MVVVTIGDDFRAAVLSGEKLRGAAEGHGVLTGASENRCTGIHLSIKVVI